MLLTPVVGKSSV